MIMARKRTPTKEMAGQSRQSKESASKPEKKQSPTTDEIKQQSRPSMKTSHLTLFTISMTIITALVCYSFYPELVSSTSLKRKPVPSLRKIVQSNENSHISKRGIIVDSVSHASIDSETISNIFSDNDEGMVLLATKITTLQAQKRQESENAESPTTSLSTENQGKETSSESDNSNGVPVHDTSHKDDLLESDENLSSNSDNSQEKLSADSDTMSDQNGNDNQDAENKPQELKLAFAKNGNPADVRMPIPAPEMKSAGGKHHLPERKEKVGETGPIVLNAENSQFSVNFDTMQIEKIKQSMSKNSCKSKEVRDEGETISADKSKKEENNSKTKIKSAKMSKPKQSERDVDSLQAAGSKTQAKQASTKRATNDRTLPKQQQLSEESTAAPDQSQSSGAAQFQPSLQKTFTPKKIFYGGRRIAPLELLHQKPNNSSVKVYLFDDFLSQHECEGLMRAHTGHVEGHNKPPILCFNNINTLRKHIRDAGKKIKVTPKIFTAGTTCVNASFSLQLQNWLNSNWSYSTAFYPGESKFSNNVATRMEKAMGLKLENGGKFQITSYPLGKAYKTHTDCTVGSVDKRDRVVSVLMYLNDAEDGGETKFPDLGIWVKPKRGRAIVWNNMSPAGECDAQSRHAASLVKRGKKYILIRWYYYKSFPGLGVRSLPPHLPPRDDDQAMVSCDDYDNGSCRWYDEWTHEHLLNYQKNKLHIT